MKHTDPKSAFLIFQKSLQQLTVDQRAKMISSVLNICKRLPSNPITTSLTNSLKWIKGGGLTIKPIWIVAGLLLWETSKGINDWWDGRITGTRCVTIIIEKSAAIGGACVGVAVGSAVGTQIFPGVGTLVGGVIGGFIGGAVAEALAKWLNDYFFDRPKDIALENAYAYLQLRHTCSNDEINESYKKLLLIHHPDKGGKPENFIKLQVSLAIIKEARGQGVASTNVSINLILTLV
ncbi:unnamed protein product [Adineta steineri]|uniref:J domain-containing protein n=1 Tax=Adineta steineri TaxID=433720 RepID=A0A814BKW6_9BILA|nr:unnamed protein product [Adineta steineri]CAF0929261.1 unnamed protein product [Adineta steineri]